MKENGRWKLIALGNLAVSREDWYDLGSQGLLRQTFVLMFEAPPSVVLLGKLLSIGPFTSVAPLREANTQPLWPRSHI